MQALRAVWRRRGYQVSMAGVIVLALFMRFYHLHELPPGLFPDEAANGLDIFRILEHHQFQPFYATNGGREALFFYFQAIGVMIFGNTTYALRVAPAVIGTLACGAVYLWASSWFGKRVGLLAALLMAVTPWAVTISRDGFRAGMVALMVPLILWLGTKAYRSNNQWWYAATGIAIGAGFYTYIAYRLFPLALLAGLGYLYVRQRRRLMRQSRNLVLGTIVCIITLIPLGIYGVMHPAELFSRAGGVSFTNPSLNHGHPLETLGDTIVKTALMFNFHGDNNYRQNLGGQPELNVFVGIMFLLGLFLAITKRKDGRYFGVLAVFGVMLLPEVLSAEGIPHALRAIGALPSTLVLAALGINYMLESWYGVFPLNSAARTSGTVAVAILLLLTIYQGYVQYFVAWANAPQTYAAYAEDTSAIAQYYLTHPFNGTRYAIGDSYDLMPLEYLAHNHVSYTAVDPSQLSQLRAPAGVAKQFTVEEGNKLAALKILDRKFPNGQLSPHYSSFSGNELFVVYTVPAT